MLKTYRLLARWLPLDLAAIAHSYIEPATLDEEDVGKSGHYELCSLFRSNSCGVSVALTGACIAGDFEIVALFMSRGAIVEDYDIDKISVWPDAGPSIRLLVGDTVNDDVLLAAIMAASTHHDLDYATECFFRLHSYNRLLAISKAMEANKIVLAAHLEALGDLD